ncbi:MAG: alpha/beta hydrolase [Myxococcota bacterium]
MTSRLLWLCLLVLLCAACGPVTALRGLPSARMLGEKPYLSGSSHPKHRLDLIVPRQKKGPLVLYVHGGYWISGDKRYLPVLTGLYGNFGQALAREGIATAITSYRLAPEVDVEGMLSDVAEATRSVLQPEFIPGYEVTCLVMVGHSAGGHLATMSLLRTQQLEAVGVRPSQLAGVVSVAGVLDVPYMAENMTPARNEEVTHAVFGRDPARLLEYSPSSYLQTGEPPLLILLGEKDYRSIYGATHALVKKRQASGLKTRFVELKGYSHEALVLRVNLGRDPVTKNISAFVKEVCAPASAPTPTPASTPARESR